MQRGAARFPIRCHGTEETFSLTRSPSSFSSVTSGTFLRLPVPEGDAAEVAQPLPRRTVRDSPGRTQFRGGLKVDAFLG